MKQFARRPSVGLSMLATAAMFVIASCSAEPRESFRDKPDAGSSGGFATDSGTPAPQPTGEVYGHTDTILYVVDTKTHGVREIGAFQGCTHIVDIALDESSTIYGSTGAELWLIENGSARCTKIAAGSFPNSLSFVPVGTLEPSKETLVGFEGGDYVKIDPKSGEVTKIGAIGSNLESSGDMVSVKEGKSFLTVKGPDCADCLAEIDPKTGALVKNWGSLGHPNAYGLAFWGGELYAFTEEGDVLLIKLTEPLSVEKISVPNAPTDLAFRGAGSTTVAPTGDVR